jgi:hypothetical protein
VKKAFGVGGLRQLSLKLKAQGSKERLRKKGPKAIAEKR